jgi:hypothetical protein
MPVPDQVRDDGSGIQPTKNHYFPKESLNLGYGYFGSVLLTIWTRRAKKPCFIIYSDIKNGYIGFLLGKDETHTL